MGFWYFLMLLIGLGLTITGLFIKKRFRPSFRIVLALIGMLFIALSLFMFSPGSAEIIADLFNLNRS